MATRQSKKKTDKPTIGIKILSSMLADRHSGDPTLMEPKPFINIDNAREEMNRDVINYLNGFEAVDPKSGAIDYDTIDSIDGGQDYENVKDLSEYITSEADSIEINVDSDGTWAKWDITESSLELG